MAVAIFMIFSFIFMLLVRGPVEAVVIVMIQGLFFAFEFRNKSGSKQKTNIEIAYEKERKLHPDETNPQIIEELVRKRLMRGKMKRAGLYVGSGFAILAICSLIKESESLLYNLFVLSGAVLVIIGVCSFAKAMHDPLTPSESEELARRDAIEKGGEPICDIKESVVDNNLSNSQIPFAPNTPSQKPQEQGLGISETRHWHKAVLDVKLCETEKKMVSKSDIITELVVKNSKPSIWLFVLALVFTLPVAVFLVLAINVGWMFLIGVVGFAAIGGLLTYSAIDSEVQRRQRLKNAINEDVNISFFTRTCTDKQWGDCETGSDDPEISVVAYQLFFGGKNYRVSKKVYDRINVNDSFMFVRVDGEELSIAYPLKYWDIEED